MGDVQGCGEEFEELLVRAESAFGEAFTLWQVGDLINRGPQNLGPLRRMRSLVEAGRGHYVLGNHEISLLRCWLGLRALSEFDSFGDVLAAPDFEDWAEWLRRRPLALAGTLGEQHFAMVHAGVHPDWSLDELEAAAHRVERRLRAPRDELRSFLADDADPDADLLGRLTRCRRVGKNGSWSSDLPESGRSRAWHEVWTERGHDYGIVYGHWALQGLQLGAGLRGLDTGCVHHGRGRDGLLTAWLPDPEDPRPFDSADVRLWQVPARRTYYLHRDGAGTGRADPGHRS